MSVRAWVFREFELIPSKRQLTREGVSLHLQPKTYQVLVELVKHAGEVVSRESLQSSVWAGTYVGDANLTNSIAALRKALAPDAIETVSKTGYRFAWEVNDRPGVSQAAEALLREGKELMARRTTESVAAAQNVFCQAIAEEPWYAEAWAWLARASRYLEKYHVSREQNRKLAEAAFRRAFLQNPDLPSAHQFYTTYQSDRGDALGAMKRLLERVARFPEDANSYAGLVQVCRFNGLLEESVDANDRALQIAPDVSTSVAHTHFALGDYREVIESYAIEGRRARGYLDAAAWACVGDPAWVAQEISARLAAPAFPPLFTALLQSLLCALQNDARGALEVISAQDLSDDPESALYFSRHLARCGCRDAALQLLGQSIDGGLYIPAMLDADPWFGSLQKDAAFHMLNRRAAERHAEARAEFERCGGRRVVPARKVATRRPD